MVVVVVVVDVVVEVVVVVVVVPLENFVVISGGTKPVYSVVTSPYSSSLRQGHGRYTEVSVTKNNKN